MNSKVILLYITIVAICSSCLNTREDKQEKARKEYQQCILLPLLISKDNSTGATTGNFYCALKYREARYKADE